MSRYVERAENVARFIWVNLNLSFDLPGGSPQQWWPLVFATGDDEPFRKRFGEATKRRVIEYLTFDRENPNSILEQIGEAEYIAPEPTDPPMVGVPGREVFRFKAISAGQETLELLYRRSWETDVEPAKTFSIDVTVH